MARNAIYDRQTVEVMRRVLAEDSCGIDIGAHRGTLLREMTGIAPLGRHYAFEPLPHLAHELRAKFPGVQVHEAAVSDRAGRTEFLHVENDEAYSGLQLRLYDRSDPIITPMTVDLVRLDDVIPDDQPVAFMKIDVEGGEFDVLQGAVATIRRARPVIVFEAEARSTGQYGVAPQLLYRFVTGRLGYRLSTMERWLAGAAPLGEAEWCSNWQRGEDFYFIADPDARLV